MKIIGIETLQPAKYSNVVWVRIHTDGGIIGLGETYRNVPAIVSYIHETCAPFLIGKSALDRNHLMDSIRYGIGNNYRGYPTRSVEVRGNSAIDIALWDLYGKHVDQPLYMILGGAVRDDIEVYNTCAGAEYNNAARVSGNQLSIDPHAPPAGPLGRYDDLVRQIHEPAELASELIAEGIRRMKIWPFDFFARRNSGDHISSAELDLALRPIRQIRDAVGNDIDIMVECHGLWKYRPALKIADALRAYDIFWVEDPFELQFVDDLARYARRTGLPVAAGENFATTAWCREALTAGALDYVIFDVSWIGGITEALRVTHLAEAFNRHVVPHDCTGPVVLLSNLHLLKASRMGLFAEIVRAYMRGFYSEVLTKIPSIKNGRISPPDEPGHGGILRVELLDSGRSNIRLTGTAIPDV